MSRYHGIPYASVVFLLLFVCFTHTGLGGKNCIFTYNPLTTVNASRFTEKLKECLLLDYPVSVPSNLKPDGHCFELWQLHFIFRELRRMIEEAGSELKKNISYLEDQLNLNELFEYCKLESQCVDFERANVSLFLDSIHSHHATLSNMDTPLDFSDCMLIRCQSDSLSTPYPGYSPQLLGNMQTSKSVVLQRHHWLPILMIPLLVCLFSIVTFLGRLTFQPLPLQV